MNFKSCLICLSCNILKLTKGNNSELQKLLSMVILGNRILKFENNCQIYDVTNR